MLFKLSFLNESGRSFITIRNFLVYKTSISAAESAYASSGSTNATDRQKLFSEISRPPITAAPKLDKAFQFPDDPSRYLA